MERYHIETSSSRVVTHTQGRPAFEPKGWQVEYRAELRQALRALKPTSGRGLVSELIASDDRFFNVENVLMATADIRHPRTTSPSGE